jgi:hypothetical protein
MRLRRSSEAAETPAETTVAVWDGIPAAPAGKPVIRAPRAGDLVAPASAHPHAA